MTLTEQKATARKAAFARRKLAHGQGLECDAAAKLAEALAPFKGQSLAGYMPIRTEVSPLFVMSHWLGPVCVPVIVAAGQALTFHQWNEGCEMIEGAFGAHVPLSAIPVVPQVLIVPLVAFDRHGGRLGYGGGFYDRTLELLRAAAPTVAIGFAFSAQESEGLPLEKTDQPLDMIVTEKEIIRP